MATHQTDPTADAEREKSPIRAADYRLLAEFRYLLRCFLEFSESAAVRAGLTTRQHQALLAIKGAGESAPPTVGDLAERLRIRHHSAVELADRLAEAGLLVREHDESDRRRVKLRLTESAEQRLAVLSSDHLAELKRMRPALQDIFAQVDDHAEGSCSGRQGRGP